MPRLTAERIRGFALDHNNLGEASELLEHAARVVEAANALLTILYQRCGDDPEWQEQMDALDNALEGTD